MVSKCLIKKNAYYDSLTLMVITCEIETMPEVENAVVVMGTELNKALLSNVGLLNDTTQCADCGDLIIAVRMSDEAIVEKVESLLIKRQTTTEEDYFPATLEGAKKAMNDANIALISLPGEYAGAEARNALMKGMHVMLFSDNVSIEQEKELKQLAVEKGLLMMGPDCGTAVINQIPLAFANVVRKGNIGIVEEGI
jgi:FdrA protein